MALPNPHTHEGCQIKEHNRLLIMKLTLIEDQSNVVLVRTGMLVPEPLGAAAGLLTLSDLASGAPEETTALQLCLQNYRIQLRR